MLRIGLGALSIVVVCGIASMGFAHWGELRLKDIESGEHAPLFSRQRFAKDLGYFDGLGIHRSGSVGDVATTHWLEQEFKALGYQVRRESFWVNSWQIDEAQLLVGDNALDVFPQFPVKPTSKHGISAPISLWNRADKRDYGGHIVVMDSDFSEHRGSLSRPDFYKRILAASESGAAAVVVITHAGCGRYQALNAPLTLPHWKVPVVVAGENDEQALLQAIAEQQQVSLRVRASPQSLEAFNLVAQIGPGGEPAIVVSTPQSGWFTTTAERGTGVAAFLALARWAATQNRHYQFYANSGHERGNAGAHIAMKSAPSPDKVALWIHIGANAGALGLAPDEQVVETRYLMTNWWQMPKAWSLFRRHRGMLSWPIPLELGLAAGELRDYHNAGYPTIGNFGSSPWHHCPNDRLQQASVDASREVALSYAALLAHLFPAN